jgi:hypothetical protein
MNDPLKFLDIYHMKNSPMCMDEMSWLAVMFQQAGRGMKQDII